MEETATTNDNEDGNRILIVAQQDPERYPYIVLKGTAADLSALRGTDEQTRSTFFEERNSGALASSLSLSGPLVMESSLPVSVTITTAATATTTTSSEVEEAVNEATTTTTTNTAPDLIQGELFVTNTQVLFVANDRDQSDSDLAIGAACIVLHAMMEDPEPAVYLQLSFGFGGSSNSGENGENGDAYDDPPTEITVTPTRNDDGDCETLFEALCRLISLHPLEADDDDDEYGGGTGGGWFGAGGVIGGGFGDDWAADYGESIGSNNNNDDFVWAAPSATTATATTSAAGAATAEQRDAMLEHLDNLLVVRPGLELQHPEEDGQFDDAANE
mmetsp:Transcript_24171/g.51042  ORF Transcript_24171/g.51042 Transcript_24171/m.51042 type:complete len:331 (-) Transcript_24171:138-1130(-)